jgi:hypothetical protein
VNTAPPGRGSPGGRLLGVAVVLVIGGLIIAGELRLSGTRAAETAAPAAYVTNAQLDRAFDTAMSCVRDRGVDATIEHDGVGGLQTSAMASTEDDLENVQTEIDACFDTHFRSVATDYLTVHGPTAAEQAASDTLLLTCLADKGIAGDTLDEVMVNLDAAGVPYPLACFRAAEARLREPVRARGERPVR